jgi:serine phosphatase RsbU (regulator of sigma subunit)
VVIMLDVALAYLIVLWLVFSYWRRSSAARRLALPLVLVTAADLVSLAYDNLYLAGISSHIQPNLMNHPFILTYPDAARVLFLAAMAFVLVERFAETQAESSRLQAEFEAARTVQQVLIPDFLPPVAGLVVQSAYLPAQEVGGDFFQVLPMAREGDAFIVVGDVSGKGLKAAMTVSLVVGTLRTLAEYVTSPAEMLTGLNRRLHGRDAGFATCLVLKITREGDVTIANAGHPNPYLDGVEVATRNNLPLGLTLDVEYSETHLHIDPAQSFTLVTDGVVEATAATTRELFGFDRTEAISRQAANAIAEAARAFGLGAPQADDITVLTVVRV